MAGENLNSGSEIETVKQIYEALNRNEISACLGFFDEKVERFESFGSHCHGLAALENNFRQGRDTWAEGSRIAENMTVVDDKVVVFVHVNVRQKNKTEWIDGQVTDVFTFKAGKVVQFFSFGDRAEGLKFAGVSQD